MDPAVVLALIAVLAVVLAATGVVLNRRSLRRDGPGEAAPRAPEGTGAERIGAEPPAPGSTAVAPPPATAPTVGAPPTPLPAPTEVEEEGPPRLRDRLGKTRGAFMRSLAAIRGRGTIDDASWEELEETLLLADVGLPTTELVLARLRERVRADRITDAEALIAALRDELVVQLDQTGDRSLDLVTGERNVWMFVGVNGVGKTTTIAKVAQRAIDDGHQVVLAAGDTFRAAAAEQLTHWADQVGASIVKGQEGADPGSVVFDAMSSAESRDVDLVLVDTAGRLHTKVNLMNELEKLKRIVDRAPGALKEMLLVLDATTGQNGLTQARQFTDAVGVTGVVLTKLDGSARGGIVLAIESELGIPVKLVGVGERPGDLVAFEPATFVDALLS
jgi:fused signal recognition particle receptor